MNNEAITETEKNIHELAIILRNMDENELYHLHHIRCEVFNAPDDHVYFMNEFDELINGMKPMEIAFGISFGDFNPHDEYFGFDAYANFVSFNYLSSYLDLGYLAREITESDELADALVNAGILEEWRDDDE